MRDRSERRKKADGPFGIRTSVWLIVFGMGLLCALAIQVSAPHAGPSGGAIAAMAMAEPQALPNPQARVRKIAHREASLAADESWANSDSEFALLSLVEQIVQDRRTWMDHPE